MPGGRSIVGFLERLREDRSALSSEHWRKLQFFMVDERLVPVDHEDSNYRLVSELFFKDTIASGLLAEEQVHPFILDTSREDYGVGLYEEELKRNSPQFDIALLGVGEDAHVGALFPNHHSIKDPTPYFITMEDSPKPPPKRMSASVGLLRQAKIAMGLFLGEAKKQALANYCNTALGLVECPAKILDEVPQGYVITDLP